MRKWFLLRLCYSDILWILFKNNKSKANQCSSFSSSSCFRDFSILASEEMYFYVIDIPLCNPIIPNDWIGSSWTFGFSLPSSPLNKSLNPLMFDSSLSPMMLLPSMSICSWRILSLLKGIKGFILLSSEGLILEGSKLKNPFAP